MFYCVFHQTNKCSLSEQRRLLSKTVYAVFISLIIQCSCLLMILLILFRGGARERSVTHSSGAARATGSETDGEETAHRESVLRCPRRSSCERKTVLHRELLHGIWIVFRCVMTFQIKKLKELRAMLMETDPCVAVTVRKLVMVSLMEVFKDIVPAYRIRPLTEEEKATKVQCLTFLLRSLIMRRFVFATSILCN